MSKARELAELGNAYSDGALSNRNKIINGSMTIDQRNAGAAVVISAGSASYTTDRWQVGNFRSVAGNLTVQRSSTAPENFRNSLFLTNGGAGAGAAGDAVFIQHKIEGFNAADLGFGTSSAQPITISFWVRSSVTGTYGVSVRGSDRSYIGSVTINQADTFEYNTLTIPAITTGTWNTTNGEGLNLIIDLGVGSDNSQASGSWQNTSNYGLTSGTKWYLTNGATFYLTGVQLEAGDTATPFEHRSYGQELALCQRYYTKIGGDAIADIYGAAYITGSGFILDTLTLPVKMRVEPTGTKVGTWSVLNVAQPGISYVSTTTFVLYAAGTAIGQGTYFNPASTGYLTFDAEL